MIIPDGYEIRLPDRVKQMLGMDKDEPLISGTPYDGDFMVDFMPERISIYLNQLSSTDNLENRAEDLDGSRLLGFIQLSGDGNLGEYFHFELKPDAKQLQRGDFHELDFDFKIEWRGCSKKLDNHDQPIDLELFIR